MLRFLRHVSGLAIAALVLLGIAAGALLAWTPFRDFGVPPSATGVTTLLPGRTPWATIAPQPTATLLPDLGVRLGPPHEVNIVPGVVTTRSTLLWKPTLVGGTLVAQAAMGGGRAIVAIDLSSGAAERLTPVTGANRFIVDLAASENWIAWLDKPDQPAPETQLYVLNRSIQSTPVLIRAGALNGLSLANDQIIWREIHGSAGVMGIYGHDITANRPFTVTETHGSVFEPKLCAPDWVIYLDWLGTNTAALQAHNLATTETLTLGQMYYSTTDPTAGEQHVCDGHHVAYISMQIESGTAVFRQHLYDLDTRLDRVLDMPAVLGGWPRLRLSGDVLIGAVGYDLSRNQPFNALRSVPIGKRLGSAALFLSDDRLVWLAQPDGPDTPQRLYYAIIIRDTP